uniref:Expressed conserved protein n=1 Tax=Steinernema glaseri TaxID=37863 RepID=A0A1I7Z7C2_9BILA
MAKPHHIVRCSPGQSCYDEYYAFNTSEGHVRQHFDRFCVFQAHCSQRGIDNGCLSLDELDEVVQRTFYDNIKKYDKLLKEFLDQSKSDPSLALLLLRRRRMQLVQLG